MRNLSSGCKIEDDTGQIAARLDNRGYWCTFRQKANFYRRSLNGEVVVGSGAELLPKSNYSQLHQKVIGWLQTLTCDSPVIRAGQQLTLADYQTLADLYREAYPEPVTILPPDRYQDVVLQPARGCPNRRCTFCAFYKDKPYRVLSELQFEQHVQSVEKLLGTGFGDRGGVFLGSANALALSQRRLRPVLERIRQNIPQLKRGVACFADPDFSARRTAGQWQALADYGLRHVIIGLETGYSELRASLGKSGDLSNTRKLVAQLHQAGIGIGITLLTGIGGPSEKEAHFRETLTFVDNLDLDKTDMIYLSPLSKAGLVLNEAVTEQQELGQKLKGRVQAKVVPYQMQRFNYYS